MGEREPVGRILIGEDQPEILEALHVLLGGVGYEVASALTPAEIWRRIAEKPPFDLVLMDLNYHRDTTSGSEGVVVLRLMQADVAPPPVIVMTAWGSVDVAVKAMHLGARDFVQKPWETDSCFIW